MRTSSAGISLIKRFEGLRLKAYLDAVNVPTIGYGHTGLEVKLGLEISLEKAEELLRRDLARFEAAVNSLGEGSPHHLPCFTQNQFDACVSLCYNIGVGAFLRSTLYRLLREGKSNQAAAQFERWNRAGGKVLAGLTVRRKLERTLFEAPWWKT